jgi:hypothetical protein
MNRWQRACFAVRALGLLVIFLVAISPRAVAASGGCDDCPAIAGISCVTAEVCSGHTGEDACNSPLVPSTCQGCYFSVCADTECSGQYGGLVRLECRQIEPE